MKILSLIRTLKSVLYAYDSDQWETRVGALGKDSYLRVPISCANPSLIFVGNHSHIFGQANYIIRNGKFIVGDYTGIAQGLTVITGNHISEKGKLFNDCLQLDEQDVIIEDDVRIGAFVTILPGVKIRRGAIIGAGTVLRFSIPPYAVVTGNPAKIVGFRMNPQEALEHEAALYPEEKRLSADELFDNYEKYYFNRMSEIIEYLKV